MHFFCTQITRKEIVMQSCAVSDFFRTGGAA
jgi:hypothetical protein